MSTVKHTIEPNRHLNPPTPYPHKESPDLHDSEKSPLKVQGGPDPRTPPASYGPAFHSTRNSDVVSDFCYRGKNLSAEPKPSSKTETKREGIWERGTEPLPGNFVKIQTWNSKIWCDQNHENVNKTLSISF